MFHFQTSFETNMYFSFNLRILWLFLIFYRFHKLQQPSEITENRKDLHKIPKNSNHWWIKLKKVKNVNFKIFIITYIWSARRGILCILKWMVIWLLMALQIGNIVSNRIAVHFVLQRRIMKSTFPWVCQITSSFLTVLISLL